MIYSKRSTLYDTSDQSEHRRTYPGDESPDEQRWDNEGGGPHEQQQAPTFHFAGELTTKPAWSVLSLAELNEALRRDTRPAPNPARPTAPCSTVRPNPPARSASAHEGNAWEYAYEPLLSDGAVPGFHT